MAAETVTVNDTTEKGIGTFSSYSYGDHQLGYASSPGAWKPHGYSAQGYPPQGCPPQGYSPQGCPPQGYPQAGYQPTGYLASAPHVAYSSSTFTGFGHGGSMGAMVGGGGAAGYGTEHLAHEAHHGQSTHYGGGKFEQHSAHSMHHGGYGHSRNGYGYGLGALPTEEVTDGAATGVAYGTHELLWPGPGHFGDIYNNGGYGGSCGLQHGTNGSDEYGGTYTRYHRWG